MLKLTSLNTGRVMAEERLKWRFLDIWAVLSEDFIVSVCPQNALIAASDSIRVNKRSLANECN